MNHKCRHPLCLVLVDLHKRPVCALCDFIAVGGGGVGGGVGIPLTAGGYQGPKAFCLVSSAHLGNAMNKAISIKKKGKLLNTFQLF